jgi:hypothetical protein
MKIFKSAIAPLPITIGISETALQNGREGSEKYRPNLSGHKCMDHHFDPEVREDFACLQSHKSAKVFGPNLQDFTCPQSGVD